MGTELSVTDYARVHKLSVRTAYRHVTGGTVVNGDRVIRRGKRYLVLCTHAIPTGDGMANAVNVMPISAKNAVSPVKVSANSCTSPIIDPFESLLLAIRRHGTDEPGEIASIVDAWEDLDDSIKRAFHRLPYTMNRFVEKTVRREVDNNNRVIIEGNKRRGLGAGHCMYFDAKTSLCRFFRNRATNQQYRPTVLYCALCSRVKLLF